MTPAFLTPDVERGAADRASGWYSQLRAFVIRCGKPWGLSDDARAFIADLMAERDPYAADPISSRLLAAQELSYHGLIDEHGSLTDRGLKAAMRRVG